MPTEHAHPDFHLLSHDLHTMTLHIASPAPDCRCPITCFTTTINRYHDNRYCGCAAHADAPELARPGVRSASDGDAHICAYRIGNPDCIADDHPAADPKPDCPITCYSYKLTDANGNAIPHSHDAPIPHANAAPVD